MFTLLNFPLEATPPVVKGGLVHSGESARGGHQLEKCEECPRAWYFKYHLKVQAGVCPSMDDKVPAWATGTVVHQWLANHFALMAGFSCDDPNIAAHARAHEVGYPQAFEPAAALAQRYARWVAEARPEWRPIAIEPELQCDFGEGGVYTSGADIIFWDDLAMEYVIVDWKTAGRVQSAQGYEFSTQYLRYRMILRELADSHGKPEDWGSVYVGLIPTGKTNFHKKDLIKCRYFPTAVDDVTAQTARGLHTLAYYERHPERAGERPVIGHHCSGPYSGCAFRRDWCFVDGRT
jgi:hypothetical protein